MKNPIKFLLILLSVGTTAYGQQNPSKKPCIPEAKWANLPAHPRLFANSARFIELTTPADDVSENILSLLKNEAEKKLSAEKIIYPTVKFKLFQIRDAQSRIITLSMAYRIFGDKRYFEKAKSELMQLVELPDWTPSTFLDVGESCLAAGIGLDWLYNDLTPSERNKIERAIVNLGLLPSLEQKESTNNTTWVNGNFNWNQVCHAGLVVSALAIAEKEPVLSRKIVERAIVNIPYAGAVYAPDGTYAEGPGYWSYGTTFHVFLIEALRSVFNTTCDLEKFPGFLKTSDFISQITAPTGNSYNYSDAQALQATSTVNRFSTNPLMTWFAREKNDRNLIRTEINSIALAKSILDSGSRATSKKNIGNYFPFQLLWWKPELPPLSKISTMPLHWTGRGNLPLAVMRSEWDNPQASFIAMKGGTPNNSHGHMDVGSFILEAMGERWALDMGTESYDKMRDAKIDLWNYSQNSGRWATFRTGPDGHNILRFDNAEQLVSGFAEIATLPDKNGVMANVIDLTPVYKSKVKKVSRTISLYPNKTIGIEDKWITGDKNVAASFQWLTAAKVSITSYGVQLQQNGKTLKLIVEVKGTKTVPEILIEDVSKAKNPQDSPNPGISRIVIKLNSPKASTTILKISAVPEIK